MSEEAHESRSILSSSAVMAAGTVVSRLSGFVRAILLLAALGTGLHGEVFTVSNTVPNMLYILLAGGVFNAVLVPQLVRAMRTDADGGAAYTSRVFTAALLFLGVATVLLVAAAPWVVALASDPDWLDPARDSAVALTRYCLPQVFFYGAFVLVGQVLNARGRFGPMMWAPIANNVISVAVLAGYLVVYGGDDPLPDGGFTGTQELVLGVGSTLGIAVQLLVLLPFVRAAGIGLRPRFDLRGTGLAHTLRLGVWTVLFVLANQAAYLVVTRLGTSGPADGGSDGTGITVYSTAFLFVMVPHSIVTVSLSTAILPRLSRLAADGDLLGLGTRLAATLRTVLAVVLPFAAVLPLVAPDAAKLIAQGEAAATYDNLIPTLALFGPAVVLFTVHYVVLRGFYAVERTRTVFFIQVWVAATNIVVAVLLVRATSDAATAPSLVVAYAAAYLVGSVISYTVLSRSVGGLQSARLVRFVIRMLIAIAIGGLAALGADVILTDAVGTAPTTAGALIRLFGVGGVDVLVFLFAASVLRLDEVTELTSIVTRRRPPAHRA